MTADKELISPELRGFMDGLKNGRVPTPEKPSPVKIPLKALAILLKLQEQIERNQAQMKGIVQGVSSVIDVPQGAGIDLGTGVFISG